MFKRFGLFILTNILVVVTISVLMSIFGVQPYLTNNGLDYNSLMIFCLLWGFVGSGISLLLSKFMAKKMMGLQMVEARDPRFSGLVNRIHRLAKAANLPKMPEVGIYESADLNAFATGPSKSNSLVAVSTGLLNSMSEDELEGVLAHEISHIANGDMVTMALIQGVMNAFVMFFARVVAFAIQNSMRSSDSRESRSGGIVYYLTVMVLEIAFGMLAMIVVGYFSRVREYRADAGGGRLAGRDKMIAALKKLQSRYETMKPDNSTITAFKISSKTSGIMSLLSTHPPLEQRIKALTTGSR